MCLVGFIEFSDLVLIFQRDNIFLPNLYISVWTLRAMHNYSYTSTIRTMPIAIFCEYGGYTTTQFCLQVYWQYSSLASCLLSASLRKGYRILAVA